MTGRGITQILDGVDKSHVEIISFNDLSDVTITKVADNDIAQFNSTSGEWENVTVAVLAAQIAITDLSDVNTTGVSTGDFLQKSAGDWVDFDLFGTENIWTGEQHFGNISILNYDFTQVIANGDTELIITEPTATTEASLRLTATSTDFNLYVEGDVILANKLIHLLDANTFIAFTNDKIVMQAGGDIFLEYTESLVISSFALLLDGNQLITMTAISLSPGEITFNTEQTNTDFRVETQNLTSMFFIDSSLDTATFGSKTSLAFVGIDGQNDEIQFLVQANATQTTDIFVVEASDGTDYFVVESDGTSNIKGEAAGQLVAFVYNQATAGSANQNMRWGNLAGTGSGGDGIIMPSAGSIVAHTTSTDITSAVSGDVTFEIQVDNNASTPTENEFLSSGGTGRKTAVNNVARNTADATFTQGQNLTVFARETGDMAWDDTFGVVIVQLDT